MFFNNENSSLTENLQEDIPFWNELLAKGYIFHNEEFADNTTVYFEITDANHDGLERSIDINNGAIRQITFNMSWDLFSNTETTFVYFDIDSYDDTLICRLRMDDNTIGGDLRLSYFNGASYTQIEDIGEHTLMTLHIT